METCKWSNVVDHNACGCRVDKLQAELREKDLLLAEALSKMDLLTDLCAQHRIRVPKKQRKNMYR